MIYVEPSGMFVGWFDGDSEGLDGDGWRLGGVTGSGVLVLEQVDSSVVCLFVCFLFAT